MRHSTRSRWRSGSEARSRSASTSPAFFACHPGSTGNSFESVARSEPASRAAPLSSCSCSAKVPASLLALSLFFRQRSSHTVGCLLLRFEHADLRDVLRPVHHEREALIARLTVDRAQDAE